jgi:hypothetical protein
MSNKKLDKEVLELYSELTHSLLPLVLSIKSKIKAKEEFELEPQERTGQIFFYQPQAVLLEIINSDWFDNNQNWMGYHVTVYVLEDAKSWKGKLGEAWLSECLSNNKMWLVSNDI